MGKKWIGKVRSVTFGGVNLEVITTDDGSVNDFGSNLLTIQPHVNTGAFKVGDTVKIEILEDETR